MDKCIIVCPSSLVRNWANEFTKWLGPNQVGCLVVDHKGTKEQLHNEVKQWCMASGRSVTLPGWWFVYLSIAYHTDKL